MKKILLIEDEEIVRTALSYLLKNLEYETIEATNGSEGVRLSKEHKPDLILCDVNMPGMDGLAVLKNVRSEPTTNTIPFIFLTGQGEREDLRKGMNSGADDYLTKPVSLNDLRNSISVRLNRHEEITNQYTRELQQAEEKFQHLFHYDTVTELPNRLLMAEEFQKIVSAGETDIAVLCVTVDRFRRLNGTLGPAHSDLILNALAQRLQNCLHNENVVGRISEDEFAILVPGGKEDAMHFADRLLHCIENPVLIDTNQYYVTASVGIALNPADGDQFDSLFSKAGSAARKASEEGGNQFALFSSFDAASAKEDLHLENDLRKAIEQGGLELHYQPQIDVQTGTILGCEALLRWNHPHRGFISPMKFIPIAEESGLIISLGEWVLLKACSDLREMNMNRSVNLRMSVNLSVAQFKRTDLVDRLAHILAETGINPADLELEVTETVLINNAEGALVRLNELKALGVHLSLDDFGTGFSSLSYLKNFPFDALKIDRSFIKNIENDYKNRAIVTAIIQMSRSLKLRVIAEGVETASEFSVLSEQECDEVQGYLFSPAVPMLKFGRLLASPWLEVENVHRNN
jgi:diguanylate cyclase (GGDEF)-like protein